MLRLVKYMCCILFLGVAGQTGAQPLDTDTLVQSLTRPAPAARGIMAGQTIPDGPDAAAQAFLEGMPTRGLSIEARTQLATIATTWELPRIDLEILFDFDSDRLRATSLPDLFRVGQALTSDQLKSKRFVLAGHTDGVGSASYNQDLSERRAWSVREYLVETFYIPPERLVVVGFGLERLKNPYDPRAAENRRVEIINLEVGNY
jgi:outer membrane protein OmpA-like peptidoglycan-associated protein